MKPPILHVENLSYRTEDGRWLFKGLHFEMRGGECLLISGPNGSGKSTLLNLLMKRLIPANRKVRTPRFRGMYAFIPQLQNMEFHLPLTLRDVVEISHGRKIKDDEIEKVGLLKKPTLELTWSTASGGERQRTLLTTALLQKPRLLILDEPFNHLDQNSQNFMVRALTAFLEDGSGTDNALILVSHVDSEELKGWGKRLKTIHLPHHPGEHK